MRRKFRIIVEFFMDANDIYGSLYQTSYLNLVYLNVISIGFLAENRLLEMEINSF